MENTCVRVSLTAKHNYHMNFFFFFNLYIMYLLRKWKLQLLSRMIRYQREHSFVFFIYMYCTNSNSDRVLGTYMKLITSLDAQVGQMQTNKNLKKSKL